LDDDQIAIGAVRAGAQDYLVKNSFQPQRLARYINMALTRQRGKDSPGANPDTPGAVFSFIGSKGGVGTSTTAVNVAALFARNALTVLIELQPGCPGTLSGYLRTEPVQFLGALLRKPANTITPPDFEPCLKPIVAGLGLFCFPASPGTWRALDAEHVQAIVSTARAAYPIVVLDLPPRIDEGVARALQLSDSVTVVADLEAASLQCGAALVHQIRMATSRTKELSLALIGRTAVDSPVPLGDLQAQLEIDPLVTVPSSGASIALSYAARTPLVLLYPEDPYSVAHFELAEKLLLAASAGQYQSLGSLRVLLERESAWLPIPETTYG
jgi:Flp pilus assembly CpaE family ATPase